MSIFTKIDKALVGMLNNLVDRWYISEIRKAPENIYNISNPSKSVILALAERAPEYIPYIQKNYAGKLTEDIKLSIIQNNQEAEIYFLDASGSLQMGENGALTETQKVIAQENEWDVHIDLDQLSDKERINIIEAVQILQGDTPERFLGYQFEELRRQFANSSQTFIDSLNDYSIGLIFKDVRMMSDEFSIKKEIYQEAQLIADEIKKSLSPNDLSKYASDLLKMDNIGLGRVPNIKDTLSLFSKEYIIPEYKSALVENMKGVGYSLDYNQFETYVSKGSNLQFVHAGNNPYSPNYKELFETLGLKNEFDEFEKSCIERTKWNGRYSYAVQNSDIVDIFSLEKELPKLDQKVDDSKKALYESLVINNKAKELDNIEYQSARLHHILDIGRFEVGELKDNRYEQLINENFSSEYNELLSFYADTNHDKEYPYDLEGHIRLKAGEILENKGILAIGTTEMILTEEGYNTSLLRADSQKYNEKAVDAEFKSAVENNDFDKLSQLKDSGYMPTKEMLQLLSTSASSNSVVAIQKIFNMNSIGKVEQIPNILQEKDIEKTNSTNLSLSL